MGPQRVRHEWQTLTSLHFFSLPWSCHSASPYQTFGCLLSCNLGGNLESNPEGSCRSSNICNYCPVFYKKKKTTKFWLGHNHNNLYITRAFKNTAFRASLVAQWSKNPPANAGDPGLIPEPGRPPHATGQLSIRTTTTESALCSRRSRSYWAHAPQTSRPATEEATCNEKPRDCSEE